jgi:hypothetical protein
MFDFDRSRQHGSPLPVTLEDALAEIIRLRHQLIVANQKWAKVVEARVLDNRANAGQLAALRKELEAAKDRTAKSAQSTDAPEKEKP